MICFRQDVIWVRDAAGRLTALHTGRLAASIKRAAAAQGISDWWLADGLSMAVQEYVLRNADTESFIEAAELADAITSVLNMLGYTEIATAYKRRHERAEIHLGEMNVEFELEFYRELDAALSHAAGPATLHLQVTGLRFCVMRLCGAHRWSATCRQLAEEIVMHVGERVAQLRDDHAAALRFAVTD
jgi:hypothetical protein